MLLTKVFFRKLYIFRWDILKMKSIGEFTWEYSKYSTKQCFLKVYLDGCLRKLQASVFKYKLFKDVMKILLKTPTMEFSFKTIVDSHTQTFLKWALVSIFFGNVKIFLEDNYFQEPLWRILVEVRKLHSKVFNYNQTSFAEVYFWRVYSRRFLFW